MNKAGDTFSDSVRLIGKVELNKVSGSVDASWIPFSSSSTYQTSNYIDIYTRVTSYRDTIMRILPVGTVVSKRGATTG